MIIRMRYETVAEAYRDLAARLPRQVEMLDGRIVKDSAAETEERS